MISTKFISAPEPEFEACYAERAVASICARPQEYKDSIARSSLLCQFYFEEEPLFLLGLWPDNFAAPCWQFLWLVPCGRLERASRSEFRMLRKLFAETCPPNLVAHCQDAISTRFAAFFGFAVKDTPHGAIYVR